MATNSLQRQLELAELYFRQQNFVLAKAVLEKIIQDYPNNPRANELLAYVLGNGGDLNAAIGLLEKAISFKECPPTAHYELGSIYLSREDDQRAASLFQDASSLGLQTFELYFEHGQALARLGKYLEAIEQFDLAAKYNNKAPELFFNLAKLNECIGDRNKAFEYYEKVIALDDRYAPAWLGGGIILHSFGKLDAALHALNNALAISPNYSEALFFKGNILRSLKRYQEAIDSYLQCQKINPDFPFLLGALFNAKMLICQWQTYESDIKQIQTALLLNKPAIPPFPLLAALDDPSLQLTTAKIWVENENKNIQITRVQPYTRGRNRIRIGYFSADFGYHPVAFLIAEIFELHHRDQFEIYGFSTGPNTRDPMRKRIEKSFDHFLDVESWSDSAIAEKSRELEIDIAIDLTGFTQDGRINIFGLGAAPVQVNFLGYPGTLGASYIDYIIVDGIVAPEGSDHLYAEKLAYLPNAYQPNDRKRARPIKRHGRADAGLPEQGFIFCCFNNNFKITPHQFDLWAAILKQVPSSFLWLLEDNPEASKNLKIEIVKRGVQSEKLIFAPRVTPEEHLQRMSAADLFLDTAPYNAHTTTSEALWVGLPVVTKVGSSFASRVAASLVTAVGVPELVVSKDKEYIDLAVSLASSEAKLADLRAKLDRAHQNAPLFDSLTFTKNLENLFIQMYKKSRLGQPPSTISVLGS